MATIVVGPVIGAVDATTVRILVEFASDGIMTCEVTDQANLSDTHTLARSVKGSRPCVFVFSSLKPATKYTVVFPYVEKKEERTGSFRTLKENPTELRIASLSCNSMGEPEEPVVWNDLIDQHVKPGNLDVVFHVGDQVYADEAFHKGVKLVKSLRGKNHLGSLESNAALTPEVQNQIAEYYRDFYRRTWNYPPTKFVLANVPNLTIWDDHDIRDDWGSHSTDYTPTTDEYFVGKLGQQVYWEYQRQLWDDIFDESYLAKSVNTDCHFHKFGSIGVVFIDSRGSRSFYRDDARPFLSTPQWTAVTSALFGTPSATNPMAGIFNKPEVTALVVVMSVALVCAGAKVSTIGKGAFLDKMGWGLHPKEQIDFIKALHAWKTKNNELSDPNKFVKTNRDVLVIGGDLHIAIKSEIRFEGDVIFEQIITSPIRQHPPPSIGQIALKTLMNTSEKLPDDYSFAHTFFKPQRNFGLVSISTDPSRPASIRSKFFYRSKKERSADKKNSTNKHLYRECEILITDIKGANLAPKDSGGTSDPYVRFEALGLSRKTHKIMKTLNPVYEDSLKITVYKMHYSTLAGGEQPTLYVSCYDWDRGSKDDPMGGFEVPLAEFLQVKPSETDSLQIVVKDVMMTLKPLKSEKVSGSLSFKLEFRYF